MNTKINGLYDAVPPDHCRGFFDPEKTREWVKEYAKDSFQTTLNKLESNDFKLKVSDVKYEDHDKKYSIKDQKTAILEKRDLTTPLKGTFELIDKRSGKVVDKKRTTIAHIPYITERNTVLYNGSEYITTNQQRLKPGVYTRIKDSGEVEAHVNVKGGMSGKLIFHPDKAIFVYSVGTTEIKLYGLLRDLGVPDSAMLQAWGKEIFERNKATYKGDEVEKFYNKVFTFG